MTARRAWAAAAVAACGVALAASLFELPNFWTTPGGAHRAVVKLMIHWGLWLAWPLALVGFGWCLHALTRTRWLHAVLALGLSAGCALAAWARFVEPSRLRVLTTPVSSVCGVRVALVSDIHVGLYTRADIVDRLVDRLNALDVDAVLVAGDWTNEPPYRLREAYASWSRLRHPSYGVLGNHDEQQPGPPVQKLVHESLAANGLRWIEGRRVALGGCELAGLGDFYADSAERDVVKLRVTRWSVPAARRLVLAHNPDSMWLMSPGFTALVLAGHTHGGQVLMPVLTQWALDGATTGGWQRGLYEWRGFRLFVTSGIGLGNLPLRLGMPPTIDVLEL